MNRVSQPRLLSEVFFKVYGRAIQAERMDDRVMLQKAVFLMRERGISCGDYEFVWDHYGPFSAELSDDIKMTPADESSSVKFNADAERVMENLKEVFARRTAYSVRCWAEAVASLLYLRRYMYPSYTDEEIIQVLEDKKDHLRNHSENRKAMDALKEILAA